MSHGPGRGRWRKGAVIRAGWVLLVALILASPVGAAASDGAWELKVCADPISLPFSDAEQTGFENRIVEILADELNAFITYDWHIFNSDMINLRLRQGECDVLLGVPDGFRELLTTVAYYRTPYVFVYRADRGFDIDSLDDEDLRTLRIGLQSPGIPPHNALINRGITENVTAAFGQRTGSADRLSDLVDAVAAGEVDVGIVWGPVAAYFAQRQAVELKLTPVTPEFEPPAIFMSVPMTIAVRPGDDALRDRLNIAIANRWDEIQAVLQEYGVPLDPLPRPAITVGGTPTAMGAEETLRIGVVIPTQTGHSWVPASLYDIVGEAARMGALLAEGHLTGSTEAPGPEVRLLLASAPTASAAKRAAERLLATENVHAFIGGIGEGQAEALAAVAEAHHIPFINIGSPDLLLRQSKSRYVFHVEASGGMYVDALVDWHVSLDKRRWFIVYEATAEGRALRERALDALAARAPLAEVVGEAAVAVEQPTYLNELFAARDAGADVILLLVRALDQVVFLSQMSSLDLGIGVAPYPDPVTQTRDFLASAHIRYDAQGLSERVALWETTLEGEGARELNERFVARWGKPMDPSAWAAYQAVRMLHQAAQATGALDAESLVAYLEDPATVFDVAKGQPLSFDAADHQLRQPLYVVRVNPDAEWGLNVSSQVGFASLVAEMPGQDGAYGGIEADRTR
ncbi:MAG: quinoprotein dehydrogenase-associated putative ABC transporter substrate-binding protein [Firmicutes bacterium]|nr:quinoprotein dehydrogenase-associated putative ABC transporter substrate-binding protein [Bacillota bacterium]